MRGTIGALLVGAAIFLAVGCGGSSNDAAETTTDAAVSTATDTVSTESTATETSSDDTSTTAMGLTAGCQKVADLSIQFGKALSAAGASGTNDLEQTADAYESFAKEVPEEIRAAFETLAGAYAQYADVLKGLDLEAGQVPDAATLAKLARAAKALNGEELTKANADISAWVSDNCSGTR